MARKSTIRGAIQTILHDVRSLHADISSFGVMIDIRDEIISANHSIKNDELENLKSTLRDVKRLYNRLEEYYTDVITNLDEQSNLLTNFGDGEVEKIETLIFAPEKAVNRIVPKDEIDPISLEPLGKYFFMCTNDKKKCYYNAENYANYCNYSRNNAKYGKNCPVCRNVMDTTTYLNRIS